MLTVEQAREITEQAVDLARRAGADSADAHFVGSSSNRVQVRDGAIEDLDRSEAEQVSLRLFAGRRSASVSTSSFGKDALEALAERCLQMAREAPEDPYAGLAPPELLAEPPFADLDRSDPTELGPDRLRADALDAERAMVGVAGVSKSNGCSASASRSVVALTTSSGFSGAYEATGFGISASAVAGTGAAMQRDFDWHSASHRSDLDRPDVVGRRAGERAAARLDPVRVQAGAMPVLFQPRVASTLLFHLIGAIAGSAVARKSTFLLDRLGDRIFAPGVRIDDDPLRPRGQRSRTFDGEGVRVTPTTLVDDGVLTTWMTDCASARQLGIAPTGHAVRGSGAPHPGPSNVTLAKGERSPNAMLSSSPRVLVVTELIGQGVNLVTGDYSRGAAGFLYENGERVGPVSEITIASNLLAMFAALEPANDLVLRQGIDAPSVLIPDMMVAAA